MERLTERVNDRLIMMKQDSGDNVPYYWNEGNFKVAEKLATYEDLEERLNKIFGEESTFSLADVIDALEMKLSEPDKKHTVNARILTYEEADKWQEYKNLEEQGLLVRLPVKIGDDIYKIPSKVNYDLNVLNGYKANNRVYHQKVYSIVFSQRGWFVQCDEDSIHATNVICVDVEYGKTWFITREEAEKKLEEMRK